MSMKKAPAKAQAKAPAKKKLYSITVSGQGDTWITLVTKEIWDWVNDPFGVPLPQDVIDAYYEDPDDEDGPNWTPSISGTKEKPNSCTYNDAALAAPGVRIEGESKRASFSRVRELTNFCKKHNVEIVDEWEGYIY